MTGCLPSSLPENQYKFQADSPSIDLITYFCLCVCVCVFVRNTHTLGKCTTIYRTPNVALSKDLLCLLYIEDTVSHFFSLSGL